MQGTKDMIVKIGYLCMALRKMYFYKEINERNTLWNIRGLYIFQVHKDKQLHKQIPTKKYMDVTKF